MENKTLYDVLFNGTLLDTLDARKKVQVQVTSGSDNTLGINIIQEFVSDKDATKGYKKAIRFLASDDTIKQLIADLVDAQKSIRVATAKNKELSARPTTKAAKSGDVKILVGKDKIEALQKMGFDKDEIIAIMQKDQKKAMEEKKAPVKSKKEIELDEIFELTFLNGGKDVEITKRKKAVK